MTRDPKKYVFGEPMRDHRPDGKGGFVHKDSADAYSYSSQMASQDTAYTGSNRPAVQSNAPVFQAYLKGGGDWRGQGSAAVNKALAAAYREVQRRKRPADDACDRVQEQEAVVLASYTELVQQFAGDMERSPNLERNVERVISTLERSSERAFQELKSRDRVRLQKRSDHDANEELYEWLQTQQSGIDPDDWARRRRAVIDEQKGKGDAAKREREGAERVLPQLERKLKDAWRARVKAEQKLYGLEQKLDDSRTPQSQKSALQRQADSLRKEIAQKRQQAEELVPQAVEAKKHQVHGIVREVHLAIANRLKSRDFDLTA